MNQHSPILVFSHLRWNFVYQRPQHLLSRLAATRRVLFVEEPVRDEFVEVPAVGGGGGAPLSTLRENLSRSR